MRFPMPINFEPRLTRWAEDLRKYLQSIGISIEGDTITNIYEGDTNPYGPYEWNYHTLADADFTIPSDWRCTCVRLDLSADITGARKIIMPVAEEGYWIKIFVYCPGLIPWTDDDVWQLYDSNGTTLLEGFVQTNTMRCLDYQCIQDTDGSWQWLNWLDMNY